MKNPLITMSAVTGKPSKTDIYEYLKGLKENGIEQAMLYPRSGCEVDYLSEEWFETIGNFIFCAKELDMCLWLYDDFNWPSGDAGGRVTANEKFRLQAIKVKGENAGLISCKSHHNSGLFGEKYFPNLLSHEAVEYFIKTTHEEYYKRFGEHFGTVIKGMFTDEPSIGYCCQGDSISYYDGMTNDYEKQFNRDFKKDMLCGYENFYLNAVTLISNRFKECYVSKLASWCESHGILMTGHFMCDSDPIGAVVHGGDFLDNISRMSLPGVDEIWTNFSDKTNLSLLGSAEYASGKNGAMAELFALGPCSMTYAQKRLMLYFCAAFKIDHYFLAVSHIDLRGNRLITDYFNDISTDQPDFEGMKVLAKETTEIVKLAKKDFVPDVYVRFPFLQCAKNITGGLDTSVFHDLLCELTYNQIQWKLINHENSENIPVIELNDNLEFTLNGAPFDISKIEHKTIVTDQKGDTPRGIFVRRFNDDSFVALNLFAPNGKYLVNGQPVNFGEFEVVTADREKEYKKEEIKNTFKVKYHNDNVIRTMHLNSSKKVEVQCDDDIDVVIAVRKDTFATLNGNEIKCNNDAEVLSRGMKGLYKMSDRVWINQGNNTVETKNDIKYLPSLLLVGDFACETENSKVYLKKRKKIYTTGERLYDYGKIELTTQITIPQGTKAIEFLGTKLYTKVYVDDILLDGKIASPYVYQIDKNLWGKEVELRTIQYTSISPIFGDVKFWEKNAENVQWQGTPCTQQYSFGFEKVFWCF